MDQIDYTEQKKVNEFLASPDMQKKLGHMYSSGMNFADIHKQLVMEGLNVGFYEVKNAIKRNLARRSEIIQSNLDLKNEIKEIILSEVDQIKKLNEFTWEIINDAKTNKELKLQAANQVLKQLEFQAKKIDRLKQGVQTTKINKVEMTQIIVNSLDDLEKQGYIKIISKPGEIVDLEEVNIKEQELKGESNGGSKGE